MAAPHTPTDNDDQWRLRQAFKHLNKVMILMWRLRMGRLINIWPRGIGRIMVIVHTGRKSGLTRYTPVNYAEAGEGIYCTAGFGTAAHWYKNIMANPHVELWLPGRRIRAVAEDVTSSRAAVPLLREVLKNSGFAAKSFGGVDPFTATEEEFAAAVAGYCLIRFEMA